VEKAILPKQSGRKIRFCGTNLQIPKSCCWIIYLKYCERRPRSVIARLQLYFSYLQKTRTLKTGWLHSPSWQFVKSMDKRNGQRTRHENGSKTPVRVHSHYPKCPEKRWPTRPPILNRDIEIDLLYKLHSLLVDFVDTLQHKLQQIKEQDIQLNAELINRLCDERKHLKSHLNSLQIYRPSYHPQKRYKVTPLPPLSLFSNWLMRLCERVSC